MLPNFIRERIPEHIREDLSITILSQAGKYKWSYWIYSAILCNGYPKGLEFLPDWEFGYRYNDNYIKIPRDAGIVIKETFEDKVYRYYPINKGDVVLDIGAYIGTYTLVAATAVGESGMVIAIEPDNRNMKYCQDNCAKYGNITYINKTISNKPGKEKLYLSSGSACHSLVFYHNKSIEVESTTIDELVNELKLPKVNLIKMDIEGANLLALEGAEEMLKRPEVKLAIAAYHKQPNGKPELPYVANLLENKGFTVHQRKGYLYAEKKHI